MWIEIHWTCGSLDEARGMARHLVEEQLVACAQIIPWIESVYRWKGQLETTQETKVVFKTREDRFEAVCSRIKKESRYEVPEVTWKKIEGGQ